MDPLSQLREDLLLTADCTAHILNNSVNPLFFLVVNSLRKFLTKFGKHNFYSSRTVSLSLKKKKKCWTNRDRGHNREI